METAMKTSKALFFFLLILSFILFACSTNGPPSCKTSANCQKSCQVGSCIKGECSYTPRDNCCGNGIKEATEDGKAGNECTCPKDYGPCEGSATIGEGRQAHEASYVKRRCSEWDECVLGVDPKNLQSTTLLDEQKTPAFQLEVTTTFNQPFRVPTDLFTFRLTLKDAKEGIVYPIKFNHLSLKDGELLFGEKDLTSALGGVGDTATFSVPLSYRLKEPEEDRRLSYKLDYEYAINSTARDSTGKMITLPKIERESLENRFGTKILLARDGTQ